MATRGGGGDVPEVVLGFMHQNGILALIGKRKQLLKKEYFKVP